MIKSVTSLFAVCFCCETFSQTVIDTVEYRFVYDVQSNVFENGTKKVQTSIDWILERMVLAIIIVFGKAGIFMC